MRSENIGHFDAVCRDHATGDGLVPAEELGADIGGDGYFIPRPPSGPGTAVRR